ncbi:MAG: AAA family ATPase [Thermoleophilaceae bacterium]
MPFGKDLAPGMLHAHGAHAEAVARIGWCITEQAIGVISGECGAGKTVAARAAVASLDASRHTILYLGTPGVGLRGIYGLIVTALGGTPRFHHAALIPQAQELLQAESAERGKQVVLIIDEAHLLDAESLEGVRCLTQPRDGPDRPVLPAAARPAHPAPQAQAGDVRRARSADRGPLRDRRAHRQRRRPATCSTISRSPGARTRCSPTTRSSLIYEVSRGLPRQVNNLAVGSLIAAFAANKAIVDESAARVAVAEIAAE